ncbi:MAG TPA: bifunctional demethylmenaquinone methyltransferase/2-methoxy-6-polyprenyl-1,4-benzoquinol methylase UbiE [Cryomorphaceae bacterium]|nr:bifunctional demethylmenaquinone methyltransferase/2-methoxy-6-polyprenyl-1,4-benzoquinol methylase UbiE [Cryomorphaceae bacterium]
MSDQLKHDTITPYNTEASKKEQVAAMFDNIAGKYDFLNHFFSVGIDKKWRKKAIKELALDEPKSILDVATGTGDFAFEAMRLKPTKMVGIDISDGMLNVGREKIKKRKLTDKMEFLNADSEDLPFDDNHFDAVTVSFGVRNFQNLLKGLKEINRVLKTDGKVVILEFSKPRRFPLKQAYFLYFKFIMPVVGKLVSKDKSAYAYLPQSVMAFPEGKEFEAIMDKAGFKTIKTQPVTGGIASIYTGRK